MPFNGAGVYSPPNPPTFPALSGELIRATDFNAIINDIAAALTNCVTKDNQSNTPALTVGALTVTTAAALPAGTTVGGLPALTRRYTTGEVILSIDSTAPAGTVAMNGSTIGSALSGAGRANADTQALFELLWNNSDNTLLPILDASGAATTRGASAAADFAANKRMPTPTPQDGDALLMAVSSAVMTRSVGEVLSHTHTGSTATAGVHQHGIAGNGSEGDDGNTFTNGWGRNQTVYSDWAGDHSHTLTIDAFGGTKNKAAGLFLRPYIAL